MIYSDNTLVDGLLLVAIVVGAYKLTIFVLTFGSLILNLFVLPPTDLKKYGVGKNAWAVVTGASDGIGKEFALQLAKKKFNIVLVSRTQSKLEVIAKEIETKYKVETKVVAFDASTDDKSNYITLGNAISDLPVSVLINNVGQSHTMPVSFLETSDKEMRDIITINNIATLEITRTVAPSIQKTVQEKKVKGLILNMGSFSALTPSPLLAVYTGSKAFLQGWSSALAGELEPQGIEVQLVLSYLVTSAMSKIRRTSLAIPSTKDFVASTLSSVGRRGGALERYATSTPYWAHGLIHFALENSVGVHAKVVNSFILNMHKGIRARALKKKKST